MTSTRDPIVSKRHPSLWRGSKGCHGSIVTLTWIHVSGRVGSRSRKTEEGRLNLSGWQTPLDLQRPTRSRRRLRHECVQLIANFRPWIQKNWWIPPSSFGSILTGLWLFFISLFKRIHFFGCFHQLSWNWNVNCVFNKSRITIEVCHCCVGRVERKPLGLINLTGGTCAFMFQ